MSRYPSLGHMVRDSLDFDYLADGRVARYNRTAQRLEGVTRARDLCVSYRVIVTLSGFTVSCVDLIPAGVILLGGVTTRNLTAVYGATGYTVGTVDIPDLWSAAVAGTVDTVTDYTHMLMVNPVIYPVATTVILTALGGAFTGGLVEVTAWGLPH